jgi:hypothetical protein
MRLYLTKIHHKNRAGRVTEGEGPEFKPQYCRFSSKEVVPAGPVVGKREEGGEVGCFVINLFCFIYLTV